MPCKSARRYSTSPTPCMVRIKPRTAWKCPGGDAPSFGCHWLLPRLARFQAHPQIGRGVPADQHGGG